MTSHHHNALTRGRMKLGIGTYTYMWSIGFPGASPKKPMSPACLLRKAIELGASVVQLGPNIGLDLLGESEIRALLDEASAANIEIEYGTRGLDASQLLPQILFASRLGSSLLRTVPEFEPGCGPPIREIAAQLRPLLPVLEERRVRLAIENGNIPALELAALVSCLNSPWIGVTLDTANSLAIPEGTGQVVQALAKYTFSFHVKDFVVRRAWHRMGFVVEGAPAGKGQMDLPWILEQLQLAGSVPNPILELWPPEQNQLESTIALEESWAKESIQYLRQYFPT
jgi:3-oxoisoapionate decarboxylase